jgi:hypothetical protein
MFAPGKPFEDNVVFAGKEGAYFSGTPFMISTLG